MRLYLINGYPYPTPADLTQDEIDRLAEVASCVQKMLEGVKHFEWRYELTIEFADRIAYDEARALTGWREWDKDNLILEAVTDKDAGYDRPAVIVGDTAYCGFILAAD